MIGMLPSSVNGVHLNLHNGMQACKNFDNNGTCVTQCPPATVYDPNLFRLVLNPGHRLSAGDLCVVECPRKSVYVMTS